jgi:hypothetical protein
MLELLDAQTIETKSEIAEITIAAQDFLQDSYDIEAGLMALMDMANTAMSTDENLRFRYREIMSWIVGSFGEYQYKKYLTN